MSETHQGCVAKRSPTRSMTGPLCLFLSVNVMEDEHSCRGKRCRILRSSAVSLKNRSCMAEGRGWEDRPWYVIITFLSHLGLALILCS
jgi:hypothetical protein